MNSFFPLSARAATKLGAATATMALLSLSCSLARADVNLANQPVFATSDVPGNLALALSVEYPTAISVANLNDYADTSEYLGYFDPKKCYTYTFNATTPGNSYFQPAGAATGTTNHTCSGKWSGNFMNWATMQTIDPFRWALSGGYRSVDTTTETILEKAWGSAQGNVTNFPLRGTDQATGHDLPANLVTSVTPFSKWTKFNLSIWSRGNTMVFTSDGSPADSGAEDLSSLSDANKAGTKKLFKVYVRVKVCDPSTAAGGLEANCVKYGSNYKPEGLLQQNANKIRYSTFAYLNAGGNTQQGAVMRAPMGFIGPTYPQPLSTSVVTNTRAEWDATTGIMNPDPDGDSSKGSGVLQSGVMNYLNKFGQAAKSYMTYDNVSELYYAVVRYFQNQGNVPEWTNAVAEGAAGRDAKLDGFPAVTTWADPIAYSCQKNFVLGIGDNHTHYDYNVGGSSVTKSGRAAPSKVTQDTVNKADIWTKNLQAREGLTETPWWGNGGTDSTYYIAGLAYGAHVTDIRPDLTDIQNISTYWMDVMEYQRAEDKNPYYLAAKYGGFSVPTGFDSTATTALTQSWWNTGGDSINMNGKSRLRPDNYFLAGNAAQMVSGLKTAFTNIANAIKAYTTSFSLSSAQVSALGSASYASQYDSKGWTGVISASKITFSADGTPSLASAWKTSDTMETQLAGTGWDTARRIATWDGTKGVAFRETGLTAAQLAALKPSYATANTSADYLNYLRGERKNEANSTVTGSTKAFRTRTLLLGDVVNAKLTAVGPPIQNFSDKSNPGYTSFKSTWNTRATMVYAGANDGMLHAFNGVLNDATNSGKERFAYIPSAMFQGPNATPQVDGLAQLGNPNYEHRYYVDATPLAFDLDLASSGGTFTTTSTGANANWRTLLIGGLGKGGRSFYAIDVTDPGSMTDEAKVAANVKWEFSHATMGYSFGAPIVVKTKKYGWVVVLTSGYNNSDGKGYLYFVDPKNGKLLESVQTPTASNGLTYASAYVSDFTDNTADSIYAGDLDGQVWRFDLTLEKGSTSFYPAPTNLATLMDAVTGGKAQPVTVAPQIEIHPVLRKRFVLLATGKLLDASDVKSSDRQTFYALIDGTGAGFSAVSSPITRADLTEVKDVLQGVSLSNTSKGWYFDLGSTSNIGWRVVSPIETYSGIVAFPSLLTTGDACSPSGQSRVYALNYGTGKSVLINSPNGYIQYGSAITDLTFVSVDGTTKLIGGTTKGDVEKLPADLAGGVSLRLLNWREVPTVN
ncbi:type IV pilus assembly protein PilY1 [Variovorax paradoxus]|uniref:pilus assembly protein n=1 Tax=Variovorax paradoxus TaxID=34073 RepID=UPI0027816B4C|nr:PilC/PilY family type IV pilus protein [Variovorax paradoxus]MDQ0025747.1 type IV pilus assembly protein PilY1 [Variovorax paradoxus]